MESAPAVIGMDYMVPDLVGQSEIDKLRTFTTLSHNSYCETWNE